MSDTNPIVLPDEYKEAPWAKAVLGEDGNVDKTKLFSKIAGQESLLGKKHLPGKDATDDEWRDFAKKMTGDYQDSDYDSALEGVSTKAEMIEILKAEGVPPRAAAKIAAQAIKERDAAVGKKFDETTFQAEILKALPDEKERAKAKAVLQKAGLWEKTQAASNEEALGILIAAAKIGVAYDIDDEPGKGGNGDGNAVQGNGKGYCQEYVDRVYKLVEEGKSRTEATRIAKAEYGVA